MMRRTALVAAALGALAGCATAPSAPPLIRWAKPNATYDDYLRDRYACLQESRTQVSGGAAFGGMANYSSGEVLSAGLIIACMSARGYVRDPNGFAPPAGTAVFTR